MTDPETLTRDTFVDQLSERIDILRMYEIEVPGRLGDHVLSVVGGADDPFGEDVFRAAAAHLLDGLDPELAGEAGGPQLLEDRLAALPVNLQLSLRVAAERHEQTV